MDFSSLDLLASTALRDNNPAPSDSTTSSSLQLNLEENVDNDEDDDDDDQAKEDGGDSRTGFCSPTDTDLGEEEVLGVPGSRTSDMGSVKMGKGKKGASGTAASKLLLKSIFVQDGKYMSGKIPNGDRVSPTHPVHAKDGVELCFNNNSVPDTLQSPLDSESESPEDSLTAYKQLSVYAWNNANNSELSPSGDDSTEHLAPSSLCNGGHRSSEQALSISSDSLPEDTEQHKRLSSEPDLSSNGFEEDTEADKSHVFSERLGQVIENCSSAPSKPDSSLNKEDEKHSQEAIVDTRDCVSPKIDCTPKEQISEVSDEGCTQVTGDEMITDKLAVHKCEPSSEAPSTLRTLSEAPVKSKFDTEKELDQLALSKLPPPDLSPSLDSHPKESLLSIELKETSDKIGCESCEENRNSSTLSPLHSSSHPSPASSFSLSSISKTHTSRGNESCDDTDQTMISSGNTNFDQATSHIPLSSPTLPSPPTPSIENKDSLDKTISSPDHPTSSCEATDPADLIYMDHCYFSNDDKLACLGQSNDNTDEDAFESADETVSADDIEKRPRSLSVDSEYLQYGMPTNQTDKTTLLSPTLSVDSVSNDSSMSENSGAPTSHFYSILTSGQAPIRPTPIQPKLHDISLEGSHVMSADTLATNARFQTIMLENSTAGAPKCGKFRIGTFGSFSNTHLDLEEGEDSRVKKLNIGIPTPEALMKYASASPALVSPSSPFPLQSPGIELDRSDAGSEVQDDLDSSTTEDRFLSSSHDSETFSAATSSSSQSQVWNHPVYHDHDYCCKEASEKLGKPVPLTKSGKRKWGRKQREQEEERLKKGKYLKMELLKQDSIFNLASGSGRPGASNSMAASSVEKMLARSSLLAESLTSPSPLPKPNPVGRPRKRLEKPVTEAEYDSETGTKMKITGKYQDQYVYYYAKSNRNRRRKFEEKGLVSGSDKIILPPSKPGDIVVPHLTDADCEAIRVGGRSALKLPPGTRGEPTPHPGFPTGEHGELMDSSIVNTILSMENDITNPPSPMESAHDEEVGGGDGDFGGIEEKLTSEQMDYLLDCLKDVEVSTTSQALDAILTSAEPLPVGEPQYLDSLAGTTVEPDFLSGLVNPSVSTSLSQPSGDSVIKTEAEIKIEPEEPEEESKAAVMSSSKDLIDSLGGCKSEATRGNVTSPIVPTSQPSVEKNLEFLKNTDIKPEFNLSVASSVSVSSTSGFSSQSPSSVPLPSSGEVETPWIVTVTLYFNDIPAIIINNSPYVRLVDIHRQILPAKDTGILKKRCQLMGIPVSNCTEMQRYFLVQYGRAHNSKSTLVVTKNEAFRLVSYYANPQPRSLRAEDNSVLRHSSGYQELQSFMAGSTTAGSVARSQTSSPAPGFAHPRRRGGFRRRYTPTGRSRNASPESLVAAQQSMELPAAPSPQPAEPASPSKRLRHKKINFLEMLKGEDSSAHRSPSPGEPREEDSPVQVEDTSTIVKAAGRGGGKRRSSREGKDGGSPTKRGRGRQQSADLKRLLLEGSTPAPSSPQTEPEISVDGDSPDRGAETATAAVSKGKKRSPGSPKSGHFGPIKVNVKSLVKAGHHSSPTSSSHPNSGQPKKKSLFGRRSGDGERQGGVKLLQPSPSSRVLRVTHQDVSIPSSTPPTPPAQSPAAEIHLDLFKGAMSPCVRCETCQQFLTVSEFLTHHHPHLNAKGDGRKTSNVGTPFARRRVIVPYGKAKASVMEMQLWKEFVSMKARMNKSVSPAGEMTVHTLPAFTLSPNGVAESPEIVGPSGDSATSLPAADSDVDTSRTSLNCSDGTVVPAWDSPISVCSPPPHSPLPGTHTEIEENVYSSNIDLVKYDNKPQPTSVSIPKRKVGPTPRGKSFLPSSQQQEVGSSSNNVRTSSRKRKRKQFYGFENYDFAKRSRKGVGTPELDDGGDTQDSVVDVTGTSADDDDAHFGSNGLVRPENGLTFSWMGE